MITLLKRHDHLCKPHTPQLFDVSLTLQCFNIEVVCPRWEDQECNYGNIDIGSLQNNIFKPLQTVNIINMHYLLSTEFINMPKELNIDSQISENNSKQKYPPSPSCLHIKFSVKNWTMPVILTLQTYQADYIYMPKELNIDSQISDNNSKQKYPPSPSCLHIKFSVKNWTMPVILTLQTYQADYIYMPKELNIDSQISDNNSKQKYPPSPSCLHIKFSVKNWTMPVILTLQTYQADYIYMPKELNIDSQISDNNSKQKYPPSPSCLHIKFSVKNWTMPVILTLQTYQADYIYMPKELNIDSQISDNNSKQKYPPLPSCLHIKFSVKNWTMPVILTLQTYQADYIYMPKELNIDSQISDNNSKQKYPPSPSCLHIKFSVKNWTMPVILTLQTYQADYIYMPKELNIDSQISDNNSKQKYPPSPSCLHINFLSKIGPCPSY